MNSRNPRMQLNRPWRIEMLRRSRSLVVGVALVGIALLMGGCGSKFAGEWLEDGTYSHDGLYTPSTGDRRIALKFEPPATVRYGFFRQATGVVDADSVQSTDYQTIDDRKVAEFGEVVARPTGDHLLVDGLRDGTVRMSRLKGIEIFPHTLLAPQLTRAGLPSDGAILAVNGQATMKRDASAIPAAPAAGALALEDRARPGSP